jgi:hypothetical protein
MPGHVTFGPLSEVEDGRFEQRLDLGGTGCLKDPVPCDRMADMKMSVDDEYRCHRSRSVEE